MLVLLYRVSQINDACQNWKMVKFKINKSSNLKYLNLHKLPLTNQVPTPWWTQRTLSMNKKSKPTSKALRINRLSFLNYSVQCFLLLTRNQTSILLSSRLNNVYPWSIKNTKSRDSGFKHGEKLLRRLSIKLANSIVVLMKKNL